VIGEDEVALWRQAVESADALDVYLDWLLIHDPVRGELLHLRMRGESARGWDETVAWAKALGLDRADHIRCEPLPRYVGISTSGLALLEPVLDQLPFLQVNLKFFDENEIEPALASPVIAKIRRLSFTAWMEEHNNYQSETVIFEFGHLVVEALCASPQLTQLEMLELGDAPGRECATRIAAYPFVALCELAIHGAAIGDEGVVAIAKSPIIKTLRRLTLSDSEIGDAGASTLARESQLETIVFKGHRIGPAGAAALRAMPSSRRLELVPDVVEPFASLAALRAHCGDPTMPLEQCPSCSLTPERCDRSWVSSLVSDYDVDYGEEGKEHKWDHVPAQISQLSPFLAARHESSGDGWLDDAVLRCPICARLYLEIVDHLMVGPRTYSTTSYQRLDAEALFRTRCGVRRRLPGREVELAYELFRHHAIVRLDGVLCSLDDANQLVELTRDRLPSLIASEPPSLDDAPRARRYAQFVDEIQDPGSRVVESFAELRWHEPLTDDQRRELDALRAIRIDPPAAEQVDDHFVVRSWVVSARRLICRVATVRRSGEILREDAVIAEKLLIG